MARRLCAVAGAVPLVLALAVAVAPAASGAPAAKLTPISVSVNRTTIAPGGTLTVGGKLANTGGTRGRATFAVALSAAGRTTRLATRTLTVRAHDKAPYRVTATVPASLADGSYAVTTCVARTCVTARTRLKVATPARVPASAPSQSAPAEPPVAPTTVEPPTTPTPTTPAPTPTPAPSSPPDPPDLPPADFQPGASSGGDSLFPTIGNGGYDATHYALDLSYDIASEQLGGTSTMTATATQDLSDFTLDFQNLDTTAVTVDGVAAAFEQSAPTKLHVTPASGIRSGRSFTVTVAYHGIEQPVIDPDGSSEGWISDPVYGATVVSEPMGAQGWFPNDNVPWDKATFAVRMTVPTGWQVIGTGRPGATTSAGVTTTYVWNQTQPISTYLESVSIGHFDTTGSTPDDPARPAFFAVDSSFTTGKPTMLANLARTGSIIDWYSAYYGVPYAFDAIGGVVPRVDVGYSLETVGKPTYAIATDAASTGPDIETIAHENGHMWFGDDVTLRQWKDIWLNEGMTEFSSWLWLERSGESPKTTAQRFDTQYASPSTSFWNIPPADPPTAADIFDQDAMYTRGAMVMEAIREIVGEPAFVAIQHAWLTEHAYGNATTEDYIALVQRLSTKPAARWTEFFRQWLYTSYSGSPAAGHKPQMTPANFDAYPLPGGR